MGEIHKFSPVVSVIYSLVFGSAPYFFDATKCVFPADNMTVIYVADFV